MFSRLVVDKENRCLTGLPEGWVAIFLANIADVFTPFTFCAVIIPQSFIPLRGLYYSPLKEAKVILFSPSTGPMVHEAVESYKIKDGGCLVHWKIGERTQRIQSAKGSHSIYEKPIPQESVFVCQ